MDFELRFSSNFELLFNMINLKNLKFRKCTKNF